MKCMSFAFAPVRGTYLAAHYVRPQANQSRRALGEAFAYSDETWREGWEKAKRAGYRVQKISVHYRAEK